MSTPIDRLQSAPKWRCKVCMATHKVTNIAEISIHVKQHLAVMEGYNSRRVRELNWIKFVEPVGTEGFIGQ